MWHKMADENWSGEKKEDIQEKQKVQELVQLENMGIYGSLVWPVYFISHHCIQSKHQFISTIKNTFCILRISSFLCIKEKKTLNTANQYNPRRVKRPGS